MKKIGLFYGSTGGNTVGVVDEIEFNLREEVEIHNVKDGISDMTKYNNLILVCPTYGVGELQDDWKAIFDEFKTLDFSNKNVGIISLGNQT